MTAAREDVRPPNALGLTLTGLWMDRAEWLSERLNPIVVKELRQGLRTRIFWVCFGLMLLACFLISLVAYGVTLDSTGGVRAGQGFFFGYFVCLALVQFFILPYSAYRSLAREREEETWILLSLTGIGSRRILRGKVGSFLVQSLLYASAVLPFLLFSYYLNGIDLPTILTVIALGGAYSVFLTCVCVSAATLAESRLLRGLIHFVLLGALLFATGTGLSIAGALTFDGPRLLGQAVFQSMVVGGLWLMLSTGFLLYQAAVAKLALATEEHARGPRLAMLLQVVGSFALFLWPIAEASWDHELIVGAHLAMISFLFIAGVFLLSDVAWGQLLPSHRRGWPLFRPGTLSGLRFSLLLIALTTAGWSVIPGLFADSGSRSEKALTFVLAMAAYAALYLSVPVVIARISGWSAVNAAAGLRALALVLVVTACGAPPLAGLLLGIRPDNEWLNLLNPMVGSVNFVDGTDDRMLPVLLGIAGVMVVWADRLLVRAEARARSHGGPAMAAQAR